MYPSNSDFIEMNLPSNTVDVSVNPNIELTTEESFAGIMLAAAAVDGRIADKELQNLRTTLTRTKLFEGKTEANITQTLSLLRQIIKAHGVDALLELAIPKLPDYLATTVFAIATDIAISDGAMLNEELTILSRLSDRLSIPEETVDRITEVMLIKNKG